MDISRYATLLFDCDGVVLDSNKVKTLAFYNAALSYGLHAAEALVEHHKKHGGISRYKKFEYFLKNIVGTKVEQSNLDQLLEDYAHDVREKLLTCEVSPGLEKLRCDTSSRWMIVSGGDQNELRDVFAQRNFAKYFDGGIFGSPDTKDMILERELINTNIKFPALFLGDSKYDHQAANNAGIEFLFVHDWTEVKDWRKYCGDHSLDYVNNISHLNDCISMNI